MRNGYLFDTNIWICFFSNDLRPPIVKARETAKQLIQEADVCLSVINLVELLQRSRKTKKDLKIRDYLGVVECIPAVRSTAELAGDLASKYALRGENLTTDDCLIAATTIENKLTLVTADNRFKVIKELSAKFVQI
jgi:predicted nucleic acid-binding protein